MLFSIYSILTILYLFLFRNISQYINMNNKFKFKMINNSIEQSFPFNDLNFDENEENENIIDKYDREDYSYKLKIDSYVNPFEINNILDLNDSLSINTTNENKLKELFNFEFPYINQEFIEHPPKKQKIFEINKMNKKIGRIKKNSIYKGKHNKLSEDNIIRKIKRRFHENLRLYINEEYNNYRLKNKNLKKSNNWLKKIAPNISSQIKKKDNLKWFKSKIFEIFSDNISLKYSIHPLNSNKLKIKNLLQLNDDTHIKTILNSTVEEFFNNYINNVKLNRFKTLEDDIKELRVKMEASKEENINEYLIKYENVAKTMKVIFQKKSERK